MPDQVGILRLTLADLDQPTLEELVAHGEDTLVERKRDLPTSPNFGAEVASFANMLGGWLFLGVNDDGTVHGWTRPKRVDLQSHLAAVLRAQVDPLPPFVCGMREVDGKPIAALRIFPSVDAPHIVRGTGAVYLRSSKGKEPIDDHRTLLEIARRGEEAVARAEKRRATLPVISNVLQAPDSGQSDPVDRDLRFIARAAPLTVTPAFSGWPLGRSASERCKHYANVLLPPVGIDAGFQYTREGPWLQPFGRAIAARLAQEGGGDSKDSVVVVADSGGVVGVQIRLGPFRDGPRTLVVPALLDDEIRPLVNALAGLLYDAESLGRALVDLWVCQPPKAQKDGEEPAPAPRVLHVASELTIPADDAEADALALAWHREIQRELGTLRFEGEPDD